MAIDSLNSGKSADCNGISVEHKANSDDRVIVLITFCLNSMIKYGYLPSLFMQSVITPIVKNKNGDISDTLNYRPITVASTISKILEKLLLEQITPVVMLSAYQFGVWCLLVLWMLRKLLVELIIENYLMYYMIKTFLNVL